RLPPEGANTWIPDGVPNAGGDGPTTTYPLLIATAPPNVAGGTGSSCCDAVHVVPERVKTSTRPPVVATSEPTHKVSRASASDWPKCWVATGLGGVSTCCSAHVVPERTKTWIVSTSSAVDVATETAAVSPLIATAPTAAQDPASLGVAPPSACWRV